jgi:hypothetical protein
MTFKLKEGEKPSIGDWLYVGSDGEIRIASIPDDHCFPFNPKTMDIDYKSSTILITGF